LATKRSGGRSTARRKPAARKKPTVRQHLAPWARDAFGIGLVVLGLLAVALLPGRGRRKQNRNRGWSDRPPPRARR